MTRDELRIKIAALNFSDSDTELLGEILAKAPDEELDDLASVLSQEGGAERLAADFRDKEKEKKGEDVFEGAPDLTGTGE